MEQKIDIRHQNKGQNVFEMEIAKCQIMTENPHLLQIAYLQNKILTIVAK